MKTVRRVVQLVWWDIRCQWLGRHSYQRVERLAWRGFRRYRHDYEMCRNPHCRRVRLDGETWTPMCDHDEETKEED